MTRAAIIARLEAGETGEALDLEIAVAVHGRPGVLVSVQDRETGKVRPYTYWRYTTSVDAAMSLVPPNHSWCVIQYASDLFQAEVRKYGVGTHIDWPGKPIRQCLPTPAAALCAACLRAMETTDE